MGGHDPDDHQHLHGIGAVDIADMELFIPVFEQLVGGEDHHAAEQGADDHAQDGHGDIFDGYPFHDQPNGSPEHQAGGEGVAIAEPFFIQLIDEEEGEGAEAGGHGRNTRRDQHLPHRHLPGAHGLPDPDRGRNYRAQHKHCRDKIGGARCLRLGNLLFFIRDRVFCHVSLTLFELYFWNCSANLITSEQVAPFGASADNIGRV
jgi:hypothetical protein